jgi:hypothetical protein
MLYLVSISVGGKFGYQHENSNKMTNRHAFPLPFKQSGNPSGRPRARALYSGQDASASNRSPSGSRSASPQSSLGNGIGRRRRKCVRIRGSNRDAGSGHTCSGGSSTARSAARSFRAIRRAASRTTSAGGSAAPHLALSALPTPPP